MSTDRTKYKIGQAAAALFVEKGYEKVLMIDVARAANIEEVELFTHFGNKNDIVLFIYQSINTEWRVRVADFPPGQLAARFHMALTAKIELLKPYELFIGTILDSLSTDANIGINSPQTTHIRAVGLETIEAVVEGATDAHVLQSKVENLAILLYAMHWAVLLLHFGAKSRRQTSEFIEAMAKTIGGLENESALTAFAPFASHVTEWVKHFLQNPDPSDRNLDREILKIVFNHRKLSAPAPECEEGVCEACFHRHERNVRYFTCQNLPIHFVLPAFPAKSPNTSKVLGALPDLGEEMALVTLENMCNEIQSVYSPGARVTICSDGRIFSDLVGVSDDDVTDYVNSVKEMIATNSLQAVDIVNLEDLLDGDSFDGLRSSILDTYSEDLDDLHARLAVDIEFKNLFNGIHRFISDDRRFCFPQISGSKIKEESKLIALKVIRNSNAWTRFLANVYPAAVRLSIHPYPSHSDKIGIKITKATNNWITPWHGVIVLLEDGYVLMKRSEAEALGATPVIRHNRPYFYSSIPRPSI